MLEQFGLSAGLQDKLIAGVGQYGIKILTALVMLMAVLFIAGKVKALTVKAMKRSNIDDTLTNFISNIAKGAVLLFGGVSILGVVGIETASFAAVIAASGLAIGLAFQGSLSNLAAGVMLLVFRPFKVGQVINVAGQTGGVVDLGLFTTSLDTPDKRRIIVPNSAVFGATIENISHHPVRRVDVAIGVDYSADLDETRALLAKIASNNALVLEDPAPQIVLTELGASSVDWAIRAFAKSEDYWTVREQLLETSKKEMDRADIGIPYPHMDINLTTVAAQSAQPGTQPNGSARPN